MPTAPVTRVPADYGETIDVVERLIVSPAGGVFEPSDATSTWLAAGEVIGHVAVAGAEPVPVRSPFTGELVQVVVWRGERVLPRQRIAWLRLAA